MQTPRFYVAPTHARLHKGLFYLPETASHHAIRVLRLTAGDTLALFDGQGTEARARIASVNPRQAQVEVFELDTINRESPLQITLLQGLSSADKMDWTIEKATELGVHTIVPVALQRSVLKLQGERASKRLDHWQERIIAACEQCGRNTLPTITPVLSLPDALVHTANIPLKLMLHPQATDTFNTLPAATPHTVALIIGSEGGFNPQEMNVLQTAHYQMIQCGPRVLRTETAGPTVISVLQTRWGDWG